MTILHFIPYAFAIAGVVFGLVERRSRIEAKRVHAIGVSSGLLRAYHLATKVRDACEHDDDHTMRSAGVIAVEEVMNRIEEDDGWRDAEDAVGST